ncbi:MAG: hypothetical protein QMD71_07690 [bacterium]|nr:hypothetical protein [bacterium]
MNKVTNSEYDLLQEFLDILNAQNVKFCIIGGLAVNAYAEPVVSLDLDVVISANQLDVLLKILGKRFSITKKSHSINLRTNKSDLRIQLKTDPRYQKFLTHSKIKTVLGYKLPVACIEDVLHSKIWAYKDITRRPSKRQKDLADIMRLIEVNPKLLKLLPNSLRKQVK